MTTLLQTASSQWRQAAWGERLALLLFAFTCFQAVLQAPYVTFFTSVSVNVWTGFLCLLSMLASFFCTPGARQRLRSKVFFLSLALLALVIASGLHSHAPLVATLRGLSLWSTIFGGYWCSRLLLASEPRRRLFVAWCLLLIVAFQALSAIGYFVEGSVHAYFDQYRHAQVSMWFLLAFAPLTLIMQGKGKERLTGFILLALAAGILFLSGLRTALLLPVLLGGAALLLGAVRLRWFLLLALICSLLLGAFFALFPAKRLNLSHESLYYRIENYPFSLGIAAEHPLLGVGLGVPRTRFLADYELSYPYVTPELFTHELKRIDTSENVLLTFVCGLGFPFTLLYAGGAGLLYFRLYKSTRRRDLLLGLPALAVFLPVTAGVGHFMLYDGLLQPHVSWFFHILLAFAPNRQGDATHLE